MNSDKPKVAALLSTYNGERFLREQLESVFAQDGVQLTLYVRDDGSSDSTVEILKEYEGRITLFTGSNIGVGNSFMELVYKAGCEFDYYSFCDQDDIWLGEKLNRAIALLSDKQGIPALYCSNQILIDAAGNEIGFRFSEKPNASYRQILNENKLTGCTMVWNRELQLILFDNNRRPSSALLLKRIHDVWVAMVSSVTGDIVVDEEAYIQYRQHEENVVGAKGTGVIDGWKKKLKNPSLRNGRSTLAKEILEKYSDLIKNDEIIKTLEKYAFYRNEKKCRKMLLQENISEYSGESKLSLKAKILLHLI